MKRTTSNKPSKKKKTTPRIVVKDLRPQKNSMGGTHNKTSDKNAAAASGVLHG